VYKKGRIDEFDIKISRGSLQQQGMVEEKEKEDVEP
jgi:hypothetical protein